MKIPWTRPSLGLPRGASWWCRNAQVYLQELYHAERRVASALQNLLATPSRLQQEQIAGRRNSARGVIDLVSPELFAPSAVIA